jgi:hypothetical protein
MTIYRDLHQLDAKEVDGARKGQATASREHHQTHPGPLPTRPIHINRRIAELKNSRHEIAKKNMYYVYRIFHWIYATTGRKSKSRPSG